MGCSDEDLLLSYLEGDLTAFNELYSRYKDQFFRFACFMMKDSSKAEDALQKAFIRLFENAPSIIKKKDWVFKRWMFTVIANICRDEFKKAENKSTQSLEDPEVHVSRLPHHEKELETVEINRQIGRAIEELPKKMQQVIALQYHADMEISEIAGILKIPEGTVKSRLQQAKEILARRLKGLKQ